MKRTGWIYLLFLVSILGLTGCGNGSSTETAEAHDLELPNGIESKLPLPAEASINFQNEEDGTYSLMFRPGIDYPDGIDFFSDGFSSDGWTIQDEDIPETNEGERTADWGVSGHGVELNVSLTAFGGEDGSNMSGFIVINEAD
ncbi:hypothetical protein [Salipaludibacillus daqingensis]|uniref:hypothetical protein n=1 Tax=Salipaludibacillus daqingensis TaxID=3041001 RepID=UPI00247383A9|nr:hypothetical protein [Salipaludibacillus daqingensis]